MSMPILGINVYFILKMQERKIFPYNKHTHGDVYQKELNWQRLSLNMSVYPSKWLYFKSQWFNQRIDAKITCFEV